MEGKLIGCQYGLQGLALRRLLTRHSVRRLEQGLVCGGQVFDSARESCEGTGLTRLFKRLRPAQAALFINSENACPLIIG